MIVEKIKTLRFRSLKDFCTELGPGLVLVRGPNESGKSSLHQALVTALFVSAGSTGKELDRAITWGEDARPRIEMELSIGSDKALLVKDYAAKKGGIEQGGHKTNTAKGIEEWLSKNTGCTTREVYEATACVGEEAIAIPKMEIGKLKKTNEVMERLQAMLTGAPGGSPREVFSRLNKTMNAIKKRATPKHPESGPIETNRKKLEETSQKLSDARKAAADRNAAFAEFAKCEGRLRTLLEKLEPLRAALDNNERYRKASAKAAELLEETKRLDKAEKLARSLEEQEKTLAGFEGYERLGPAVERLERLDAERKDAADELEDSKRRKSEVSAESPASYPVLLTLAVVAALAGGIATALLSSAWPLAAGAAAGLVLAGVGFYLRQAAGKAARARAEAIEAEEGRAESQLKSIGDEIEALLSEGRCGTVEEFLAAYGQFQTLSRDREVTRERLKDLAGDREPGEIGAAIANLAAEYRIEKELADSLEPFRIAEGEKVSALTLERDRLEKEVAGLSEKKNLAAGRLTATSFDPGELAELEEAEAEYGASLAHWERQLRVYEKARAAIEQAAEAVMSRAALTIGEQASPLMKDLTLGAYDKVRSDESLSLSLFSAEKGDWIEEEEMSLATREQLHLAARLALTGLITQGMDPPLLLDDPFAHYDEQRLAAAMETLKRFAQGRQVILFSPSPRYDEWADRIVTLP